MVNSAPVVVFYKSNKCGHCATLSAIWDTNKNGDSITQVLRKINPNIRFAVITAKEMNGIFDTNVAPVDVIRYANWFPMVLLVPGKVWDNAMQNLGPKNEATVKDGVQIFNGRWEDDTVNAYNRYNFTNTGKYRMLVPSEFGRWYTDSLENPDFKKHQFGIVSPPPTPQILTPAVETKNENEVCMLRIVARPYHK